MIGGILVAVGVGIAIGVGISFLIRKPITGCATLNSGDMTSRTKATSRPWPETSQH